MDIIIDTIKDTYLIIPILLIMYLCLEYLEHKDISQSMTRYLTSYGPLIGTVFGIIPQCGFGVLASMLFINKRITLGTLISVFIATSDEAVPILLTNPQLYSSLLGIIITKIILAIIVGYLVDFLYKPPQATYHQLSQEHCHEHSIVVEALLRTLRIYAFIFLVNTGLSLMIETIGPERLSYILLDNSIVQPVVSAIFGFIPNCAASVILTQLHVNQVLSFASLLAGLITNAGLGILVLLQNRIDFKTLMRICLILLASALIVSLPLQWFFLH